MIENQVSSTEPVNNTEVADVTPRHFAAETTEVVDTESETVESAEDAATSEATNEDDISDDSADDSTDSENDTNTEKKSKRGFEKRIERMNRKIAERDRVIEELVKKVNGEQSKPAANTETRPKFEDYNDIEAYTDAVTEWKLNSKLQEIEQKNTQKSVQQNYKQREEEFAKAQSDYYEVIQELQEDYDLSKLPEFLQVAFESDIGPKIAYHLATNTDEMDRIAALPGHRRLIELGKLEDRLSNAGAKETKPAKVVKVSRAPAPVTSEKGAAPVVKSLTDPNLSQAEYRELRMAKKKRF
jgi:hypothetical protein